ncbi:MAG: hypothetical protein K6B43_08725 [Treponema sp.]|nr:hypothetical protein [Treponema sp.]
MYLFVKSDLRTAAHSAVISLFETSTRMNFSDSFCHSSHHFSILFVSSSVGVANTPNPTIP